MSKRIFLQSLAAATAIAASTEAQAACFVTSRRHGSLPAKTYGCRLGERQELSVTFMRLSDLSFDLANAARRPDWLPPWVDNLTFLDNPVLETLRALVSDFGFRFEYGSPKLTYDSRDGTVIDTRFADGNQLVRDIVSVRTLGVWDDPQFQTVFPLPDDLRRMAPPRSWREPVEYRFLRFAGDRDFDDLEAKTERYVDLLIARTQNTFQSTPREVLTDRRAFDRLGNLNLMRHIGAGSVDRFLPIRSVNNGGVGCDGQFYGIYYEPPALFVDIAVLKNTGPETVVVEDLVGQASGSAALRPYDAAIAAATDRLRRGPVSLRPGDSAALVQRLMFKTLETENRPNTQTRPAEYGRSELPTGVLVDGTVTLFEGRSHVAMILTSDIVNYSCPFLEYFDAGTSEWVSTGTILEFATDPLKQQTQLIEFSRFRDRFRIVEKEAETTTISGVELLVRLADGSERALQPRFETPDANLPARLHYGDALSFSFEPPKGIDAAEVASCRLSVSGFYQTLVRRRTA